MRLGSDVRLRKEIESDLVGGCTLDSRKVGLNRCLAHFYLTVLRSLLGYQTPSEMFNTTRVIGANHLILSAMSSELIQSCERDCGSLSTGNREGVKLKSDNIAMAGTSKNGGIKPMNFTDVFALFRNAIASAIGKLDCRRISECGIRD